MKGWTLSAAAVLAAGTMVLGGCLVAGSGSSTLTGRPVTSATLDTFEKGATTESYVLDLLGQPTRTARKDADTVVHAYEWTRVEKGSGHVLLLFHGSGTEEQFCCAYVECCKGIVTNWWVERSRG